MKTLASHLKLIVAISICTFVGISCTSPGIDLTDGGSKVKVRKPLTDKQKEEFEEIQMFQCELGTNGKTRSANAKACEHSVRNQAAEVGAEFVVADTDPGSSRVWGKTCNNCVKTVGFAYRKRTAESAKLKIPGMEEKDDKVAGDDELSLDEKDDQNAAAGAAGAASQAAQVEAPSAPANTVAPGAAAVGAFQAPSRGPASENSDFLEKNKPTEDVPETPKNPKKSPPKKTPPGQAKGR